MMGNKYTFAEWLKCNHAGKTEAINAKDLSMWGDKRQIRRWCHELRLEGYPISSGKTGYYYATTPEDLKKSINFLISQQKELEAATKALSKTLEQMKKKEMVMIE